MVAAIKYDWRGVLAFSFYRVCCFAHRQQQRSGPAGTLRVEELCYLLMHFFTYAAAIHHAQAPVQMAENGFLCALLLYQSVCVCRLGQEAKAMMVPTVEDVFHADTNSTDDYLGEIQSMTILTAIQVCLMCTQHDLSALNSGTCPTTLH